MNILNPFHTLDAQSPESRFAQFTPEEHAEMQSWLDSVAHVTPEAQPTPEQTAIADLNNRTLEAMKNAFEFGFHCAELGLTLQAAVARFHRTMNS